MKGRTTAFVAIVIVIVLVAGLAIYFNQKGKTGNESQGGNQATEEVANNTDSTETTPEYREKLAKALTEKGAVFYGAYWCPHCKQQKEAFGDAAKYLDYVECDARGESANPDECKARGIDGYPTWIYQGQKYNGFQSLSQLAQMIGYYDSGSTDQSGGGNNGQTNQPAQ